VEKEFGMSREQLMTGLLARGVDTRTFFIPVHEQPLFQKEAAAAGESFPVTTELSRKGFYLPSGLALTLEQIDSVCRAVEAMQQGRP
jgi:perosamine synthetase